MAGAEGVTQRVARHLQDLAYRISVTDACVQHLLVLPLLRTLWIEQSEPVGFKR